MYFYFFFFYYNLNILGSIRLLITHGEWYITVVWGTHQNALIWYNLIINNYLLFILDIWTRYKLSFSINLIKLILDLISTFYVSRWTIWIIKIIKFFKVKSAIVKISSRAWILFCCIINILIYLFFLIYNRKLIILLLFLLLFFFFNR